MAKSLEEVHQSVNTDAVPGRFKKFLSFAGPAYMVSVGYMDPGNWATDIAGGSKFGFSLLWVLLMSNLIALLLQSHCARLGIVAGKDLAQASRETYSRPVNFFLYLLAEIAIAACDLAEVIGMAIGLQLLFGLPLIAGVIITVLDTFLLLFLLNYGIRKLEAFIIFLVSIIGLSFLAQLLFAQPSVIGIIGGLRPTLLNNEALQIAIGIIGATVMPHNLYLHSSLVQTRKFERTESGIKRAIRFNVIDSAIALNAALFVNAAILILAASVFYFNGYRNVEDIGEAHRLLAPLLGTAIAPILFAVALIASGQSSTITGTLAGQIVMEGYLNLRIQPWIRRIITRLVAIGPALFVLVVYGEGKTMDMLILSQILLSLQLSFAVVPLIHFVSDKARMGIHVIGIWTKLISWISAWIIIVLNIRLVYVFILDGLLNPQWKYFIVFLVIPVCVASLILLLYIFLKPFFSSSRSDNFQLHGEPKVLRLQIPARPECIAIAVDFSASDEKAISNALFIGGKTAKYILLHIVETPNAFVAGRDSRDHETLTDQLHLSNYVEQLQQKGYEVISVLGFGNPKKSIPELVKKSGAGLLLMGSHGHTTIKDLLLGTTVESVRHQLEIPVMIV
jgi:manganese transport protein